LGIGVNLADRIGQIGHRGKSVSSGVGVRQVGPLDFIDGMDRQPADRSVAVLSPCRIEA
jgi:hypothetical protein